MGLTTLSSLGAAVFLVLQGTAANACSPAVMHGYDKRIRVAKDCSFVNGGVGPYEDGSALATIDIGNQRVAQRLMEGGACYYKETLFFSDCSTGEAIFISGVDTDPENGGAAPSSLLIELLQPPHGPVSVKPSSTVKSLAHAADSIDAHYTTSVKFFMQTRKRKNLFDAACGCKLFYPDSVGASQ